MILMVTTLVAYFTQDTLDFLRTVDDFHQLASLAVPPGKYKTARSAKNLRSHQQNVDFISPRRHYEGPIALTISDRSGYQANRLPPQGASGVLAPLAYLQNVPPPRRHPLDEKALMSFVPALY
jgi:hypothetical protein